jgi:F-type H+-transporting ATPase subunit epsilon
VEAGRLTLTIVTPEHAVVDGVSCDEVRLPAPDGEMGILPGHTPIITLLGIGTVTYRDGGKTAAVAVREGFAEISGDAVRVLADVAADREEVDVAKATSDKETAERKHLDVVGDAELDAVNADQEYAEARLRVAKG